MKPMMIKLVVSGVLLTAGLVAVFQAVSFGVASENDAAVQGRSKAAASRDLARIVPTHGAITEIVYALGFGENIAAVDSSARWPSAVRDKPSIGYVRQLSAEGVLSVQPTLILNSAKAGPPAVIQRLRESGVPLAQIEPEKGEVPFAGVISKIRQVGRVLGVPERGDRLAADVRADLRAVQAATANHPKPKPKTLALFAHAGNRLMVSGGGTEAHAMLELIGLPNVAQHAKQWKPLSPEAFLASRPELIVLAAGGPGSDSDPNSPSSTLELARELLGPIGLDRTPAGQQKRVILVNPVEFLSGGPRVGLTAMSFARAVYPDLELPASKSRPWFAQVEGPAAESN